MYSLYTVHFGMFDSFVWGMSVRGQCVELGGVHVLYRHHLDDFESAGCSVSAR